MQDKACIGNALKERFDWHIFGSPVLQDRKAFNLACEKYDKWFADYKTHSTLPKPAHHSKQSPSQPGVIPESGSRDIHPIARSSSSSYASTFKAEKEMDDSSSVTTTLAPSHRQTDPSVSPTTVSSPTTPQALPPTRQLSRALRVFVAWKATS